MYPSLGSLVINIGTTPVRSQCSKFFTESVVFTENTTENIQYFEQFFLILKFFEIFGLIWFKVILLSIYVELWIVSAKFVAIIKVHD